MNDLPFFHIHKKSNLENSPSPLLLMVHGYGSNEQDLFSFSRAIPEKFTIVSIRGDIEIQYNGFAWYNITIDFNGKKSYDIKKAIESRDNIIKVIEICKKIYNIDPDNVNLMGFSQGSMLVNAVALTYPEKIRNGWCVHFRMHLQTAQTCITGARRALEQLAYTPGNGIHQPFPYFSKPKPGGGVYIYTVPSFLRL